MESSIYMLALKIGEGLSESEYYVVFTTPSQVGHKEMGRHREAHSKRMN